jgi:hypothetical protein
LVSLARLLSGSAPFLPSEVIAMGFKSLCIYSQSMGFGRGCRTLPNLFSRSGLSSDQSLDIFLSKTDAAFPAWQLNLWQNTFLGQAVYKPQRSL